MFKLYDILLGFELRFFLKNLDSTSREHIEWNKKHVIRHLVVAAILILKFFHAILYILYSTLLDGVSLGSVSISYRGKISISRFNKRHKHGRINKTVLELKAQILRKSTSQKKKDCNKN